MISAGILNVLDFPPAWVALPGCVRQLAFLGGVFPTAGLRDALRKLRRLRQELHEAEAERGAMTAGMVGIVADGDGRASLVACLIFLTMIG